MRVVAMTSQRIAAAMQRVESVLKRRPEIGLHEDAPATARWERGTRVVSSHANGAQLVTDMPTELGGGGDQVTPGWVFRAGLGIMFCHSNRAWEAAAAGIELTMLEVVASSRSGYARRVPHDGTLRRTGRGRAPRCAICLSKSRQPGSPPSDCNPWSKIAIPVHPYPQPCATQCRSPYGSKQCTRNGRTF